ncbi:hypothetical protein, partial [Yaniella flava]|uniref:hypothetical protein n=1 Tax=Yaniella flava TaxID=287930 RepID=UPI0031D43DA7
NTGPSNITTQHAATLYKHDCSTTLGIAVGVAAATLSVLCLALLILTIIDARTRRSPAQQLTTTAVSSKTFGAP